MFAKRTVSAILAVVLCAVMFTGCSKKAKIEYKYNAKAKIKSLDSCVLAENDNLKLSWNNDKKGIDLLVKKTGKVWRNYYSSEDIKALNAASEANTAETDGADASVETETDDNYVSTLDVYYQDQNTFNWDLASSESEEMRTKRISAEKVKNGIKLTYYFDKIKVSVPVTYVLRSDSLLMSVDGKEIGEDGEEYRLLSVVPSKHMLSVDMQNDNSYIFVSNGIGALVNTKLNDAEAKRDFSIGGGNEASLSTSSDTDPIDSCGIRAYGLKAENDALFCIGEETSAALSMRVNAGDISSSTSKVYGDIIMADSDYTKGKASNAGDVRIVSDRLQAVASVGFYPLSGDDANYIGMAECYRNYLEKKGYISNQKRDFSSPYAVTALGGVMVTESVLGVPNQALKVATTFEDAKEIFSSLSKDTGYYPVTRIKGFGESGLNIGKVGGGFTFASVFGNSSSFKALQEYCKGTGKPFYTDFDLVRYSESGSGFSYENDSAKTATLHSAEFSTVNVPLRDFNKNYTYKFLSRTKMSSAIDKLISFIDKKDLTGVSFTSLGSMMYSDYSDIAYAVAGKTDVETKAYIEKVKKSGVKVSGSSPAHFAAGLMDTVFDAPLEKSGKYGYMVEIPFYQMVFGGVVPMYSASLNTASNTKERLMLAASSGTGIGVSVIKNFDKAYMENNVEKLYNCDYGYVSDLLKTSLASYGDIYKSISGKKIVKYEFLNSTKTLTVTEFENGVKVYANHSSVQTDSPVGKLDGYGFKMERGD